MGNYKGAIALLSFPLSLCFSLSKVFLGFFAFINVLNIKINIRGLLDILVMAHLLKVLKIATIVLKIATIGIGNCHH